MQSPLQSDRVTSTPGRLSWSMIHNVEKEMSSTPGQRPRSPWSSAGGEMVASRKVVELQRALSESQARLSEAEKAARSLSTESVLLRQVWAKEAKSEICRHRTMFSQQKM